MKVGPLSAGAAPGPACYGIGGTRPTVTDANLILGRLSARGLLGGRMGLDVGLARAAFAPIADRLGFTIERAALGCIDLVVSNMVRAIRTISVERGHDPRSFALMPFGGGGPLHAVDVAKSLAMREIVVPLNPGIVCAQGLVVSDLKENFVRTSRIPLAAASLVRLRDLARDLLAESTAWFDAEQIAAADRFAELALDMRCIGQNYELSVPVDMAHLLEANAEAAVAAIQQRFLALHEAAYGHCDVKAPVEIVNTRLVARGRLQQAGEAPSRQSDGREAVPREFREVWFDVAGPIRTAIHDRDDLAVGHSIAGPAIIEQMDTTTLVKPGCVARVIDGLAIAIEVG